ncbi:bifunctional biotin--[acetyl-CoA-carboxylase] ligase/biotin operon repressor BirA [Pasteurella bettyae]|uniref:Bifunctional ligase/repressor BirA n=1 Tax=Pasteurella bettyae CCUG 2042 TaxID=1095749 RepID=I3DDG6_9PAST|nr:bifunctional biotin--[acetyl-CoA-carboxylase] ligase/biotin operon repressor BirA [Pasteurella bettyae]EIJ69759.1 biotin--[acetyl-CoA-carboxylase] ligase [Pasteurella bettyae CCUG 2042]SUB22000.1 bifunctional protein BirA [Pasteurella bettyae]
MSTLLEVLADGQPHSFEELTALLNLSKIDLLDQLETLQFQGLHFHSSLNDVQLIPQLDLLDQRRLSEALKPSNVIIKPIIDSTNQYIIEHLDELKKGDLCLSEHQTAGRGRRGRQWLSPFAGQLIMSFYWTFDPRKSLDGLSLVIGMAIADALKSAGANTINLKWPNDLYLSGRKLAGILIEIANRKNGLLNVIVGIGINLSLPKQEHLIDQPWAELCESLPHLDRNQLVIQVVNKLYQYLNQFERHGIDETFRKKWSEMDFAINELVNIITDKQIIVGVNQGIDERGYIVIKTESGEIMKFNGGEVSLRKGR